MQSTRPTLVGAALAVCVTAQVWGAIEPVDRGPLEHKRPTVHVRDDDFSALRGDGSVPGDWRLDDAARIPQQLATLDPDRSAIETGRDAGNEIGNANEPVPDNGTAIPLPPALLLGLAGLAAAGWATRRSRRLTR